MENQDVSNPSDTLYHRFLVNASGENVKSERLHSRQDVVGKCGEQGNHPATQVPISPSQVFDQDTKFYKLYSSCFIADPDLLTSTKINCATWDTAPYFGLKPQQ